MTAIMIALTIAKCSDGEKKGEEVFTNGKRGKAESVRKKSVAKRDQTCEMIILGES